MIGVHHVGDAGNIFQINWFLQSRFDPKFPLFICRRTLKELQLFLLVQPIDNLFLILSAV